MNAIQRRLARTILLGLAASASSFALHAQGTDTANPDASGGNAAGSYSLGLSFASQWHDAGLEGAVSVDELVRGIRAGLGGTAATPDDKKRASAVLKGAYLAWAGRNEKAADEFLARNAKEPGVTTTASGLQYLVLTKGDPQARAAADSDRVTVQYRGRMLDGTEFDSTYKRGTPMVVRPADVIPGWREALGLMTRGAAWRLFIPPKLAYGMTPPPSMPPDSLLIFDVALVGVEPAKAPPHVQGSAAAPASATSTASKAP